MSNNKDTSVKSLLRLGFTRDEALIYLCLLEGAKSHLEVSRQTGVNRTKVYRLAEDLSKRSLISQITDDTGSKLVAQDPKALEIELHNEELELKAKKAVLNTALPLIQTMQAGGNGQEHFEVLTYDGVAGFKQMLWHELKTKDEVLVFGSGALEELVPSVRWCESHRQKTIDAGYKVRELLNPDGKPEEFTKNEEFKKSYFKREISENVLKMTHQVAIYNDTVATYCWRDGQKVGFEVKNQAYAEMMRQIFEKYWSLA